MPPRQATDVYEAAKAKGYKEVELVIEDGKDHLYDRDANEDMASMYAFLTKYAA